MVNEQAELMSFPLPVDTHLHLSLGGDPVANVKLQVESGIGVVRDAGDRKGAAVYV